MEGLVCMLLKKKLFHSLSSTINAFYLILILLFTLLTTSIIYYVASSQVSRNTETTMDSVLQQKMSYFSDLYRNSFEQFYRLTKDQAVSQLAESGRLSPNNYLALSEQMEHLFRQNASFVDSLYLNINGYVLTQSDQQSLNPDFNHYGFYDLSVKGNEDYYWLNNHTDYIFDRQQAVQTVYHLVKDEADNPIGIIVMNLKTALVERALLDLSLGDSYMMILSPDTYHVSEDAPSNTAINHVIYQSFRKGQLSTLDQPLEDHDGNRYNLRTAILGTNKWRFVLVTPKARLFDSKMTLVLLFSVLALLLALVAVFFLRMINRYLSSPIKKMADSMMTTTTYHEKLNWSDDIPQELVILYQTYNRLTDRNVQLVEESTAQQEEKMALEVALLHAQINPHFLYNTLFSIKGLCDMGMNEEASLMISNLSDFFRTSLSRGKEVISLAEEVKNIKSYLYMMEMRYGDFFTYTIAIPESFYNYQIVKLSLQPLVENAIYHGVMKDEKKGMITIEAKEEEDDLIIIVSDNGKGIPPNRLKLIQDEIHTPYVTGSREETGVGLRSVHIRIRNRYGERYGMSMASVEGQGTRITIRMPKMKEDHHV